jgi:hypothetical protein
MVALTALSLSVSLALLAIFVTFTLTIFVTFVPILPHNKTTNINQQSFKPLILIDN